MKKIITLVAVIVLLMTTVSGQTVDFRMEMLNGTDSTVNIVTIDHDEYDTYFLESKTESGVSLGRLCIGYSRSEAKTTLKYMDYFTNNDKITYILIEPCVNVFLKMYKEEEYTMYFEDKYYNNFLTDGSDTSIFLTKKVIRRARLKML